MSEGRKHEIPSGSVSDSDGKGREVAIGNRRSLSLTRVDTGKMLGGLNSLFDTVMSGREYDARQVAAATNLSNTMIKVLKFEFEVYKHFSDVESLSGLDDPNLDDVRGEGYRPRDDYVGIPRKGSSS